MVIGTSEGKYIVAFYLFFSIIQNHIKIMRPISKRCNTELQKRYKSLLSKTKKPNFDDLKKEAGNYLAHSLAEEQGFICCYCMGEITEKKDPKGAVIEIDGLPWLAMKVEHFKPQKHYPDLVTDYENLLCACEGGCVEGEKKGEEYIFCDSHKSEKDFKAMPNPANVVRKDFERKLKLKYNYHGRISSEDEEIDKELNSIINLNCQTLRLAREAVWDSVCKKMSAHCKNEEWTNGEDFAKVLIEQHQEKKKQDGKFFPYCEMIVFLLKKRFKNLKQ